MLRAELLELVSHGESSGVEFKRDDVPPDALATEIAALLNVAGGRILLGVEDDGRISGLARPRHEVEEWVMNVVRNNLQRPIIPFWEVVRVDGGEVGVLTLPAGAPDKPYKAKRGTAWVTFVRVGSTAREATREEEARLYQSAGLIRYDLRPVSGASLADLHMGRLGSYFRVARQQEAPSPEEREAWELLLVNTDLMVEQEGRTMPTTAAILLFGKRPQRFLPQSGMTAVAYPGAQKDYATIESTVLRGPVAPLLSGEGEILEPGLVEQSLSFVRRNTRVVAWIDSSGRRQERWDYPLEAVRETVVNAIAHRDYSIAVTDIELSIFSDRLEVVSPGSLPNTVTVEKMRRGYRATRNELIKEVLRDYRYIEATGLGVPRKIVRGMREHNGTEPDLIDEPDRFTVRLWKEPKGKGP